MRVACDRHDGERGWSRSSRENRWDAMFATETGQDATDMCQMIRSKRGATMHAVSG